MALSGSIRDKHCWSLIEVIVIHFSTLRQPANVHCHPRMLPPLPPFPQLKLKEMEEGQDHSNAQPQNNHIICQQQINLRQELQHSREKKNQLAFITNGNKDA